MKRVLILSLVTLLCVLSFSVTKLVFWTAPDPQQEVFFGRN